MNCILLLLLLCSCGGWGSGNGYECAVPFNDSGCGRGDSGRRNSGGGSLERRESDRGQNGCGCEERNSVREASDCGCTQNERESCDSPGLIPPPWQEYPKFPNRDGEGDCEA